MLMVIYMNKNDLWLLFSKTGKIEYYLKYKKSQDKEEITIEDDKKN